MVNVMSEAKCNESNLMPLLYGVLANDWRNNMKTRKQYGTYENFKRDNESDLMSEYKNSHDDLKRLYEYPSFEDFCIGKWQWLD